MTAPTVMALTISMGEHSPGAESSAGARIRQDAEDREAESEHSMQEFSHKTRKASTFIRLTDVKGTKHIPRGQVIDAVLRDSVLRKPGVSEVGESFVSTAWLRMHRPDAFGLDAKRRLRPDKAVAQAQRRFEQEKVVKCGLAGHLAQKSLAQARRDRVRSVSEATNRAGLALMDLVMTCQDEERDLPLLDQTFFRRLLLMDVSDLHIAECARGAFAKFPQLRRFAGDGQLYSSAAKAMETNFNNSIVYAFEPRQKRYVREWCKEAPLERGEAWPIIKAINCWGVQEPLTAAGAAFVKRERLAMGNPAVVARSWLETRTATVLLCYRRWLNLLEDRGARLFSITPVWDIRAHFIKFDTDAMHGLMHAEGLYAGNRKAFKADAVQQFESVLHLSGLATKQWHFSRMVETDGVALCVHFKRSKSAEEMEAMDAAAEKVSRNKVVAADKRAARERSPERVLRELQATKAARAAKNKARKAEVAAAKKKAPQSEESPCKPGDCSCPDGHETGACLVARPVLREGDMAQDPGNNPNVTYVVHIVKGKPVRRRFTIGRYYTKAGVKRLQCRTTHWLEDVQREQNQLDDVSVKTAVHESVRAHIRRYARVHGVLWDEKTKARWARGRLDTYIRKPQALDEFFKEIKKDGPVTRSYYGAGKCSSSLPGTKSAPRSLCLRRAMMAFPGMGLVDENLTTQCCWKCYSRTQPVASMRAESPGGAQVRRRVRGLVFCDSRTCGHFTDRDFQGAMNILACGVGPRPSQLERTPVVGFKRTDARMTITARRQCVLGRPSRRAPPYSAVGRVP